MQYRSRSFFSSPLFSLTMQNNVTNALFGAAPMRQSSTTLVILNLKLYTTISGQCAIDSINVAIPWLCPTPIAMFVNNMFPSWPCLPFVPCSDLLSGFSVYSIFYFNLSWWLKLKLKCVDHVCGLPFSVSVLITHLPKTEDECPVGPQSVHIARILPLCQVNKDRKT